MTAYARGTWLPLLLVAFAVFIITPAARAQNVERAVRTIRARYAQINAETAHGRKVQRDLPNMSTEGGTLTGWFCGPELCKMAATFYGETGRATEEYFFWHRRLFFVLRTETRYAHPIGSGLPPPGKTRVTEQRFYFDGGRLIRRLEGKTLVAVTTPDSKKRARELQESAADFARRLRAR